MPYLAIILAINKVPNILPFLRKDDHVLIAACMDVVTVKLRVMLVHGSQDINDDDDARDDIELIVAALHEKSIEFTRQPDDEPEPDFLHRCLPHHDVALIYVKSDYTQVCCNMVL